MSVSNPIKRNQTEYSTLLIASLTLLLLGVVFLTACEAALDGEALAGQATRTEQSRCTKDGTGCKAIYNSCLRADNCDQYKRAPRGETRPAKAERMARLVACQQGCYDKALSATFVPGSELCDGRDNDYDGQTDEGVTSAGGCTTGLLGACSSGVLGCSGGAWQCTQNVQSSAELCNSLDDDCDGFIDVGACPANQLCEMGACVDRPQGYALGGNTGNGGILRYDGANWAQQPLPASVAATELFGIGGNAGNVVIVGRALLHYDGVDNDGDGNVWDILVSPTAERLWDVDDAPYGSFYAVGDSGAVITYSNGQWQAMPSGINRQLKGVFVLGQEPASVYAVGDRFVYHYDGTQWREVARSRDSLLEDVWAAGPNNVYAVGGEGTVLHYNGEVWEDIDISTSRDLYGIFGSSANDIYVVGQFNTLIHFDGNTWQSVDTNAIIPPEDVNFQSYTSVWGRPNEPNDIFVAMGNAILHYDGNEWSYQPVGGVREGIGIE